MSKRIDRFKAIHIGPHRLDDSEWAITGPGMEGGQMMVIHDGHEHNAKSVAAIANAAYEQGRAEALVEVDRAALKLGIMVTVEYTDGKANGRMGPLNGETPYDFTAAILRAAAGGEE